MNGLAIMSNCPGEYSLGGGGGAVRVILCSKFVLLYGSPFFKPSPDEKGILVVERGSNIGTNAVHFNVCRNSCAWNANYLMTISQSIIVYKQRRCYRKHVTNHTHQFAP